MEQELPTGLGEGQIAKFIEQHEVEAAEIVGDAALFAERVSLSSRLTRSTTLKKRPLRPPGCRSGRWQWPNGSCPCRCRRSARRYADWQ